jgi:hypothetical protein
MEVEMTVQRLFTACVAMLGFSSLAYGQETRQGGALQGARPKVAVLTGGAEKDLKTLRETLTKTTGVKFNADEIKFADFGRDGGLFTSFFTIELADRSKTDIGAVAKAVAAAKLAPKERKERPIVFLIVRYRPDSIKTEQLRAALAKVKGVSTEQSWAGDANLWVSVDNSGQARLAEIRDPILDTDAP